MYFSVDATTTKGKGKMINDSVERKLANCLLKKHCGHLFIFAARDIKPGEELTYYYMVKQKATCIGEW